MSKTKTAATGVGARHGGINTKQAGKLVRTTFSHSLGRSARMIFAPALNDDGHVVGLTHRWL